MRAQNGTASSALNAENGLPGAALGLNARGGAGGNAKLSPERKYRMRELATSKLSHAYRLDEVAASVATMQSASALDTVAILVLQRSPSNTDAQYVSFFHEKIPSRMMAECTPLEPLTQIIAREGSHAAPYRTRALTRIFKDDFLGAAQDLTEALAICRAEQAKHVAGKNQLVSMKQAREDAEKRKIWAKDRISENRVPDEDQPKGLEMQLLFQRGNQYLTLASTHLKKALDAFQTAQQSKDDAANPLDDMVESDGKASAQNGTSSATTDAYRKGLEAREMVRKYAKRALRDYNTFFSHLDYATASNTQFTDVFERGKILGEERSTANGDTSIVSDEKNAQALVRRQPSASPNSDSELDLTNGLHEPTIKTYDICTLLSSTPPTDIPPFPPPKPGAASNDHLESDSTITSYNHEMLTYHPLLPETLHSFLLTHCILQTAPTTLHRIANNAARLSRLADGYPFFLSARSPARADWAEILRQTNNWIGLAGTWDSLCKMDVPSENGSSGKSTTGKTINDAGKKAAFVHRRRRQAGESPEQQRDRIHKEAVMEALGDERVVDDESFQKAVKAREQRALREMEPSSARNGADNGQVNGNTATSESQSSSPSAQNSAEPFGRGKGTSGPSGSIAKDEEYLIGTERAECIARWIMEAPVNPTPIEGVGSKTKKKRKPAGKKAPLSQQPSDASTLTEMTQPE